MSRNLQIVITLGLALLLAGCGGTPQTSSGQNVSGQSEIVEGITEGNRLPNIELHTFAGETVSLQEMQGKPLVVNFWATWCGPCQAEIPLLQAAYQEHHGSGLELLAITDEQPDEVREFVADHGMTFPILFDQGRLANNKYRVQGIPTTFFLDRQGVIAARHVGAVGSNLLKVYLERIMGPASDAPAEPSVPTRVPAPMDIPVPQPTPALLREEQA